MWPKAILLDFYGTVVEDDDNSLVVICKQVAATGADSATPADIASYWDRCFWAMCAASHGPDFKLQRDVGTESLRETLLHFGSPLDAVELMDAPLRHWARPPLFPESKEVLAACKVPICLVSNADNADVVAAMAHNGLAFDFVVTSEDCRAYKPRAELFARALSLLKLSAAEVLHVGDSLNADVGGARAHGIRALWVNRRGKTVPADHPSPDHVAKDLTGLVSVLGAQRAR